MNMFSLFFFFNDTATTEIYTLSLHDALPILSVVKQQTIPPTFPAVLADALYQLGIIPLVDHHQIRPIQGPRSEEHTSELQSRQYLVCRLLLEKKKKILIHVIIMILIIDSKKT